MMKLKDELNPSDVIELNKLGFELTVIGYVKYYNKNFNVRLRKNKIRLVFDFATEVEEALEYNQEYNNITEVDEIVIHDIINVEPILKDMLSLIDKGIVKVL